MQRGELGVTCRVRWGAVRERGAQRPAHAAGRLGKARERVVRCAAGPRAHDYSVKAGLGADRPGPGAVVERVAPIATLALRGAQRVPVARCAEEQARQRRIDGAERPAQEETGTGRDGEAARRLLVRAWRHPGGRNRRWGRCIVARHRATQRGALCALRRGHSRVRHANIHTLRQCAQADAEAANHRRNEDSEADRLGRRGRWCADKDLSGDAGGLGPEREAIDLEEHRR